MTKAQKRLTALVLALMGIYGTIIALGDRAYMEQQAAVQVQTEIEQQAAAQVQTEMEQQAASQAQTETVKHVKE